MVNQMLAAPAADTELLAACAEYHSAWAAVVTVNTEHVSGACAPWGSPADAAWCRAVDRALDNHQAALARVVALPARTPEGLRAKARAVRIAFSFDVREGARDFEAAASAAEKAVMAFLSELAGEGAA